MSKLKTAKQMERHLKGMANHHRIEILLTVAENPNITLDRISELIGVNEKTISGHSHKLVIAGLLNKKYQGRSVEHTLSPYGKTFVTFLKSFQHLI